MAWRLAWHGVAWCGMAWRGMAWHDMAWGVGVCHSPQVHNCRLKRQPAPLVVGVQDLLLLLEDMYSEQQALALINAAGALHVLPQPMQDAAPTVKHVEVPDCTHPPPTHTHTHAVTHAHAHALTCMAVRLRRCSSALPPRRLPPRLHNPLVVPGVVVPGTSAPDPLQPLVSFTGYTPLHPLHFRTPLHPQPPVPLQTVLRRSNV